MTETFSQQISDQPLADRAVSQSHAFRLKEEPPPRGAGVLLRRILGYFILVPGNVSFWGTTRARVDLLPQPFAERRVGPDAFGINIAPGANREADDYVVARLKELGVQHVRLDYGYFRESTENAPRLLERLLDEGFSVLLHLVPPMADAIRAGSADVDARWEKFVRDALERFGRRVEAVEILSTPNRFTWAGFTMPGYVRWTQIAARLCRENGISWFGPNVTDFSPLYNAGLLHRLRAKHALPDAHTNNLFVDRAGEPENPDSKVLSRGPGHMHLDLVGKARTLEAIGQHFGIGRTISTYAYWTLRVKSGNKPRYVTEEAFADYLVRYLVLATTCGALSRAYWGQMVSYAKGLIDDGSGVKPETPTVHHQWMLHGRLEEYRIRPGFHALANLLRWIGAGARFMRRIPTAPGTYAMEFRRESDGQQFLVAWTRDGMVDDLDAIVGPAATVRQVADVLGMECAGAGHSVGSSPRFVLFDGKASDQVREWGRLANLRTVPCSGHSWRAVSEGMLRGLVRDDCVGRLRAILDGAESELFRVVRFSGSSAVSSAARLFTSASSLREHGIPCEPVVAVVEESPGHAAFVIECIPGAVDLPRFLAGLIRRHEDERTVGERALRLVVRRVAAVHRARMVHGDLRADNFVALAGDHRDWRSVRVVLKADAGASIHTSRRAGGLSFLLDVSRFDPGAEWRMEFIRCWRRKGSVRTRWAIVALRVHRWLRGLMPGAEN